MKPGDGLRRSHPEVEPGEAASAYRPPLSLYNARSLYTERLRTDCDSEEIIGKIRTNTLDPPLSTRGLCPVGVPPTTHHPARFTGESRSRRTRLKCAY